MSMIESEGMSSCVNLSLCCLHSRPNYCFVCLCVRQRDSLKKSTSVILDYVHSLICLPVRCPLNPVTWTNMSVFVSVRVHKLCILTPSRSVVPAPRSCYIQQPLVSASCSPVQRLSAALPPLSTMACPFCGHKRLAKWLTCQNRMASWLLIPGTFLTAWVFTGWW